MTDLELIFTMLGETQTRIEVERQDAKGFPENKQAAMKGGEAAGKALDAFEQETGDKVVSKQNFKQQIVAAKRNQKSLIDSKEEE